MQKAQIVSSHQERNIMNEKVVGGITAYGVSQHCLSGDPLRMHPPVYLGARANIQLAQSTVYAYGMRSGDSALL
jgi:hypothetical protein